MNTIGNNIKITFFGESHGPYLGAVIDNLPAGIKIDEDLLKFNLSKRRPKKDISTSRIETDTYQFISGIFNGFTTGGALTILISNTDKNSKDYNVLDFIPRPSHADYPANIKYKGYNDYRGGGFFSGRLTALWIVAGSIAEQILKKHHILIASHINSLKDIKDTPFDLNTVDENQLKALLLMDFPIINIDKSKEMLDLIQKTKQMEDAIGGIVETKAINIPIGLGEPYFLSVESYISNLLFSIPAIKGIEFGKGFSITEAFASEINDQYILKNNNVTTISNNNGGILGGLTTGRPLIIRTAVKPTPSIFQTQKSVNLTSHKETDLKIQGRHDPQIVSRAIHVINAVINFAILDLLMYTVSKEDLL